MSDRPEPPDGSVIAFGRPPDNVYVRVDQYQPDRDERWFPTAEWEDDPLGWDALLRSERREPYLLAEVPWPEVPDASVS